MRLIGFSSFSVKHIVKILQTHSFSVEVNKSLTGCRFQQCYSSGTRNSDLLCLLSISWTILVLTVWHFVRIDHYSKETWQEHPLFRRTDCGSVPMSIQSLTVILMKQWLMKWAVRETVSQPSRQPQSQSACNLQVDKLISTNVEIEWSSCPRMSHPHGCQRVENETRSRTDALLLLCRTKSLILDFSSQRSSRKSFPAALIRPGHCTDVSSAANTECLQPTHSKSLSLVWCVEGVYMPICTNHPVSVQDKNKTNQYNENVDF